MLQEVNLCVGIGNGCSRLVGKDVETLVLLQRSHAKMNLLTKYEVWPPNTSKQGVSKLFSAKVATNNRVIQFFHGELAESMPLNDD